MLFYSILENKYIARIRLSSAFMIDNTFNESRH